MTEDKVTRDNMDLTVPPEPRPMPPILVQYLTATEKPCYWCWAVLGVDVNMHAGQCRHLATVKARVEHFRNFCERVRALGPAGQNGGQQGYSVPVAE